MVKDTTLYDRLELPPTATENDIIQAGRRLSKKWHPDKNHNNKTEAEQRFKDIRHAVEILSDADRRAEYDQFGMDMGGGGMGGMGGMPPNFPFNFGGHPFGGQPFGGTPTGPEPITVHITVSLEDLATENEVQVSYSRQADCEACTRVPCKVCKGSGKIMKTIQLGPMMVQQSVAKCDACNGQGKTSEKACNVCASKGSVAVNESTGIRLRSTLTEGARLRLVNRGHVFNSVRGDVYVVLHISPHPTLDQHGLDLYTDIELSLTEALFGFTRVILLVRGYSIRVRYVGKTDYGTFKRVIGEGMNNKGDLHIRFVFTLPSIGHVDDLKPLVHRDSVATEECEHHDVEDRAIMDEEEPRRNDDETERGHSPGPGPVPEQACRPM